MDIVLAYILSGTINCCIDTCPALIICIAESAKLRITIIGFDSVELYTIFLEIVDVLYFPLTVLNPVTFPELSLTTELPETTVVIAFPEIRCLYHIQFQELSGIVNIQGRYYTVFAAAIKTFPLFIKTLFDF